MASTSATILSRAQRKLSRIFVFVEQVIASRYFLWFVFAYFVVQALFFAIFVKFDIPPDENYHYTYIKLFADNFPSPFLSNQGDNFILREAVRNPFFLYHYLLSLPYFFIRGFADAYVFLRIVNIFIGLGSLALVIAIAKRMRLSPLVTNLGVFMTVCTLMFSFLFGSINYDTLYILLTLSSLVLLLRLIEKITLRDTLLLVNVMLLGSMVKINFLPQILIVSLVLFLKYKGALRKSFSTMLSTFSTHKRLNILLLSAACLLSILFVHRYVYNVVKYQTYAPDCARIQTIDYCRKSALYARNERVFGVNRPAPTHDTLRSVSEWTALMQNRSFGVFGDLRFLPNKAVGLWMDAFLILGVAFTLRFWQRRDKVITTVLIVCLFNIVILILENYRIYARSGILELAIHGRYLFAFLPLLYLIATHYIMKNTRKPFLRFSFIIITVLVFALASMPTFIKKADANWYTSAAESIPFLQR